MSRLIDLKVFMFQICSTKIIYFHFLTDDITPNLKKKNLESVNIINIFILKEKNVALTVNTVKCSQNI